MPTPQLRGSTLNQLQYAESDFDPQRGYTTLYEYKGISYQQLQALQAQMTSQGISSKLSWQFGMGKLSASDPTAQYTIDSWEVVGNELSNSIWSHPSILNTLSGNLIAYIQTQLALNTPPGTVVAYLNTQGTTAASVSALVGRLYTMYQSGQTDYLQSQYVVRHKTNVPNNWNVNVSDINVNCIYSSATFFTEVSSTALWTFPMPARLQAKLAAAFASMMSQLDSFSNLTNNSAPPYYAGGFLKKGSTESNAPNNRIDITTEYSMYVWSTDLYSLV